MATTHIGKRRSLSDREIFERLATHELAAHEKDNALMLQIMKIRKELTDLIRWLNAL